MATLRNKLIFSYSILALLIVAVISLVLNVFLDKVFTEYAISKQQRQMQQLVSRVNQNFRNSIPSYRQELFEVIGKTALENGMILHVSTSSGEIDWDVRRHYRDQCQIVLDHAKFNMHSINPNLEGRYQEQNFLLGNNWGTITIGFYGPHNFTDEDVNLITTINRMLINITIGSLLLAVVIGFFMARVFSLPLGQVLAATQKSPRGNSGRA